MKKTLSVFLLICLLLSLSFPVRAEDSMLAAGTDDGAITTDAMETAAVSLHVDAASAVLMDAATGTVLFAQNAEEALPPASVTKVMTLLLVMEAIAAGKISWDGNVTASEHAASMGGSQIYLKVGEQMTVEDLVKSVVIASANDAACALAEYVAGSEEAFVAAMNEKAAALGMTATHFENTNGLDDTVTNHVTSAKDIAIMSRELMKYPKIMEFSSTWMDSIRSGAFTLTNTNRLVRFYPGATGLKTGSTAKAKFCVSATAERDGFSLIAVIMGAPTRDVRNAEAKKLLDYGFANYGLYRDEDRALDPLPLPGGVKDSVSLRADPFAVVLPKESLSGVRVGITLKENLCAPLQEGEEIGKICYTVNGKTVGQTAVRAAETVEKITFPEIFRRILRVVTIS